MRRHIILDDQYRSISSCGISAVEAKQIRDEIIIVVFLKCQAELGDAHPVDEGISPRVEPGGIPAACLGIVRDKTDSRHAGWLLKVRGLERISTAEGTSADIDDDLLVRAERIRPKYTLLFDLEDNPSDDSVIRERSRVEG